ncbi:MAG TPA: hypothetical protein VJT31_20890, partial [Rugosimonospora sp.]|nr:hypothetical protein [Rugosimonospora sp.]
TGEFVAWGREHFVKGDWAKYQGLGGWYQVTRVNAKSLSVAGDGWPPTISWDRVAGRRRNGQQCDTPNGEPWPVELAQRVARWRNLMSYAATAHQHAYDSPERRRADLVGYARRLVHRLPITASGPQLQAVDLAGLTIAEQRFLASRYLEVFERLDAGQRVPDVAAWLATLPAAPGQARWVMPTDREPVDRLLATTWTHREPPPLLQVGDLVVGYRDRGFAGSGQHLVRSFCGPVTAISPVRNRHEAGEFVTVTLDGDEHEFRLPMWVAVHPAGTWEQTAVPAAPATAAEEVVLATPPEVAVLRRFLDVEEEALAATAQVAMLRQVLESLCTDLTQAGEDVHADQIRRMASGLGHGPAEYAGSVEPASVPARLRTMPTPAPHRHRFEQAAAEAQTALEASGCVLAFREEPIQDPRSARSAHDGDTATPPPPDPGSASQRLPELPPAPGTPQAEPSPGRQG